MLHTLVRQVLLQNAQDFFWGLTVFLRQKLRSRPGNYEVFPAAQLCGVGKEDSEAAKAWGRTWHRNKEQDFIMLNAVQTDLDAALFPKDLQAEQPRNLLLHTRWVGVQTALSCSLRTGARDWKQEWDNFYCLGVHRD